MAKPPLDARPDPQQVRALIDQWRDNAADDKWHSYFRTQWMTCASELEALLASSAPEPTKECGAMLNTGTGSTNCVRPTGHEGGCSEHPSHRRPLAPEGVTAPSPDARHPVPPVETSHE